MKFSKIDGRCRKAFAENGTKVDMCDYGESYCSENRIAYKLNDQVVTFGTWGNGLFDIKGDKLVQVSYDPYRWS